MFSSLPTSQIYSHLIHTPQPRDVFSQAQQAKPLYLVTGASFTEYDAAKHGHEDTHAMFLEGGKNGDKAYLMNNGATIAMKLIQAGENVLLHGHDAFALSTGLGKVAQAPNLKIVGGDISVDEHASNLMTGITDFALHHPTSEVRIMAYQSFAQTSGNPFKTMIEEEVGEVERAASRRIRFVFNMSAINYWLLEQQKQASLRIVSLSALAAHRPSFGLMADTADKVMNEACWRTFHIEANHLMKKPVNVVLINPGITTACDVYRGDYMKNFLHEEATADGFPMDQAAPIPQLSAHDVAEVATRMLRGDVGADPNKGLSDRIIGALNGGYSPEKLKEIFKKHVAFPEEGHIQCGTTRSGPDHLFAGYTEYGRLPTISDNGYQRISLTPTGQTF